MAARDDDWSQLRKSSPALIMIAMGLIGAYFKIEDAWIVLFVGLVWVFLT